MTNTKGIMTIIALTTILFTGGFVISPYAYSTGYNDDSNDDSHDDSNGKCNDDSNGDCIPDPCDCEKPDKLTVRYQGPGTEDNPAIVEIYKKTEKIGDKDPLMSGIEVFVNNDPNDGSDLIVVSASDFGKKKLGSNTGYRILWDIPGDVDTEGNEIGLVEISRIDIHTSCSKLLYIGQPFTDGGDVTLIVEDGTRNGDTSIPSSDPLTCEADEQPTPMSSITVKKALTHDNGGVAVPEDFTVTLTNIGPDGLVGGIDDMEVIQSFAPDASFSVEIPAGTYTLNEDGPDSYTTVMIAGDTACPSMEGEPFKLKKDMQITCTIYNDDNFVEGGAAGPAPTVFVTSRIIDPSITITDFMYTIGSGVAQGNNSEFTIVANTPAFFTQTNHPDVLPTKITGDGNCPEVLIGIITLSSGQDITCVLEYGKVIEPGVVFHFNNLQFMQNDETVLDGCQNPTAAGIDDDLPCIFTSGETVTVADPALLTTTTIFLWDLLPVSLGGLAQTTGCNVQGVEETSRMVDDGMGGMRAVLAFSILCTTFEPIDSNDDPDNANLNYAFIETVV